MADRPYIQNITISVGDSCLFRCVYWTWSSAVHPLQLLQAVRYQNVTCHAHLPPGLLCIRQILQIKAAKSGISGIQKPPPTNSEETLKKSLPKNGTLTDEMG